MAAPAQRVASIYPAVRTAAERRGLPALATTLILFWLTAFSFQRGIGAASALQGMSRGDYGRGYIDGVFYLLALVGALAHPNETIRLAGQMRSYLVFVAFVILTAAWSAYPSWVVISAGHYTGLWLVAAVTAILWSESRGRLYAAINVTMILYLIASLAVVAFDPAIGVRQIPDAYGGFADRWQGFASHPNDFAYSTIFLVWSALAARAAPGNTMLRRLSYVTIPLALAISAFGARSATATIANLGVVAAHVALPDPRASGGLARRRLVLLTVAGLGLAAAAVAILIVAGNGEGGGSGDLGPHGMLRIGGRDLATMSGRTRLWAVAWWAISQKPWTGWSFDSLASFFDFVGAANFPYNQFHNGWIDLMVRGGAIGLLLGVAMVVRMIIAMIRLWRVDPVSSRISATFLVAVMLENLSEAQLGIAGNPLWAMLVVLWAMNEMQVIRARSTTPPILSAQPT